VAGFRTGPPVYVFEEAFGSAEEPDTFDAEFVAETFDAYPALAKVDADVVDDWVEAFAKRGAPGERALRLAVAESLLESAWGEGPQAISSEHVDDALDAIAGSVAKTEVDQAAGMLTSFLGFLAVLGSADHLHLHDNHGLSDEHLPIGAGTIDWRRAGPAIAASYQGIAVVEGRSVEEGRQSLEAIRGWLR
jgi:hypothetical protein